MDRTEEIDLAPFDASDYLDNEETIAEYLAVALKNPDSNVFLVAGFFIDHILHRIPTKAPLPVFGNGLNIMR